MSMAVDGAREPVVRRRRYAAGWLLAVLAGLAAGILLVLAGPWLQQTLVQGYAELFFAQLLYDLGCY